MKKILAAMAALMLVSGLAMAQDVPVDEADRGITCSSGGATGDYTPGEWMRELSTDPDGVFNGLNPAEMAEAQNESPWKGGGEIPHVGAFIDTFCTNTGEVATE